MQLSGTIRFLKGKKVPFCEGRVRQILKFGEQKRIVIDDKGNRKVVTKQQLMNSFNKVLAEQQMRNMMRTVREAKDLTATAMIGGVEKGKRKKYASAASARRAIRRAYNK